MNTRGRTITVTDRGQTIVLRGYKVAEIARHAGLRPIYSGVSHGWVADGNKLADLLAFCQLRRIAVDVSTTPTDREDLLPDRDDRDTIISISAAPADVDLFGGAA